MGVYLSGCSHAVENMIGSLGIGGDGAEQQKGVNIKGVEYTSTRLIGEGGYAFVYEGFNSATGMRVALKRYVFSQSNQQQSASDEVSIHQSVCPNEHIVTYFDSEVVYRRHAQLPEMWVVLEYCEGPTLQSYINSAIMEGRRLSVNEVYDIIRSVMRAIGHLHSQSPPVSHWDIKPDNFIFSEGGSLKLCDFGSASRIFYVTNSPEEVALAESELDNKMTLFYRSPETIDLWSKQRVDMKADMWAFGVLVYVLIFMEMPFEENKMDILGGVPKNFRDGSDTAPAEFRPLLQLVQKCLLVKRPLERTDIFSFSEEFEKIAGAEAVPRPKPGFQSMQRSRF